MKDSDLESPIRIERSSSTERIVFSVRLPDEIAALIRSQGLKSTIRLKLDQMNPLNNELVIEGFNSFPLNRVPETQVVNVLRLNLAKDAMDNLGVLKEKLMIKQELEETKKAQIRQDSADAERVRTARKTVTIDDHLTPSSSGKRRMTIASSQSTPIQRIFKSLSGERLGGEARVQAAWAGKPRARPTGAMILPRSQQPNHRSNGSQSERDSQHSWSPAPTEHAASPLDDGFFEKSSKVSSVSEKTKSISVERKAPVTELIAGRLPTAGDRGSPAYHQLAEEFGRRYGEYLALNEWADRRLEVFRQLQEDLCSPDNPAIQQQVIFRLVVEDQRLKNDREYQEKLEKLEECCASLMMIKARLRTAKSSKPG